MQVLGLSPSLPRCAVHKLHWHIVVLKGHFFLFQSGVRKFVQQSHAPVPSQNCVIISWRVDLFCFFEIAHGFPEEAN